MAVLIKYQIHLGEAAPVCFLLNHPLPLAAIFLVISYLIALFCRCNSPSSWSAVQCDYSLNECWCVNTTTGMTSDSSHCDDINTGILDIDLVEEHHPS